MVEMHNGAGPVRGRRGCRGRRSVTQMPSVSTASRAPSSRALALVWRAQHTISSSVVSETRPPTMPSSFDGLHGSACYLNHVLSLFHSIIHSFLHSPFSSTSSHFVVLLHLHCKLHSKRTVLAQRLSFSSASPTPRRSNAGPIAAGLVHHASGRTVPIVSGTHGPSLQYLQQSGLPSAPGAVRTVWVIARLYRGHLPRVASTTTHGRC